MTGKIAFISDWSRQFGFVSEWVLKIAQRPLNNLGTRDWRRLVDLYRISNIGDVLEFNRLHRTVAQYNCVPNIETLLAIGEWKAPRAKPYLQRNTERAVREVTGQAIAAISGNPSVESSEEAIRILWGDEGLHGFGVPMASVLLTLYDPTRFGVIDTFAWHVLFDEPGKSISSLSDWRRYLVAISQVKARHGLTCREIDEALWYLGTLRRDLPPESSDG